MRDQLQDARGAASFISISQLKEPHPGNSVFEIERSFAAPCPTKQDTLEGLNATFAPSVTTHSDSTNFPG
jgi:hypothetical protein